MAQLTVRDITGSLVKQRAFSNNNAASVSVDISDLANGQYIFSLTEKDGRVSNLKVTVAK
jgi:hypothetical protein